MRRCNVIGFTFGLDNAIAGHPVEGIESEKLISQAAVGAEHDGFVVGLPCAVDDRVSGSMRRAEIIATA